MTASHPIRVLLSVCLALWLSMTVAAQEASTITTDSLSRTQWQFVASTNEGLETPALPDGNVTLAFNETVITGSSGCNTYNGSYMLSDIFTITVGPLATTRRACTSDALMQQEQFYLEALQAASSITRSGDMLTIQDNAAHSLIFLRILALEESVWQLTSYGPRGAETPVIENATITLGFEDGNASGTAGCNTYGGAYTHDAAAATLTFGGLFMTEMACVAEGVMEQEAAFVAILGEAIAYQMQASNLTIMTQDDQVLQFTRLPALENTLWQLVTFGDENAPTPAMEDRPVMLILNAETGEANGMGTCNYYGGPYILDVEAGTLAFESVYTTLMACAGEGVMEMESAYIDAFRAVTHYTLIGDTLTLVYGEGQALVYHPAYQATALIDQGQ